MSQTSPGPTACRAAAMLAVLFWVVFPSGASTDETVDVRQDASGGTSVEAPADAFELPVGWKWELEPAQPFDGWQTRRFLRFVESGAIQLLVDAEGGVVVQHVQTANLDGRGARATRYQPYLVDRDGKRLQARGHSTMRRGDLAIASYQFAGDAEDVAEVGLARLTLEGRKKASAHALEEAAQAGADVLSLPLIGEPFEFGFLTMDGGRVRSDDLLGKVVLIDCWATWCGPCMAKMPALREMHEKYADDGLVIIGINFDNDAEKAEAVIQEQGLAWTHVHASTAAKGLDDLWERAAGITSLPRLFLIDREGVLRDDFYPHDLEDHIKPLIEEAASQ